jgi:hypothetical protein
MNKLKQSIQCELDSMKLKYEYNNEGEFFAFSINMDNSIGSLRVIIQLMEDRYLVYAILNNRAQKAKISAVSEFLHRVNSGLINGNFELDYVTGEVRYKSFVNAKETSVSGVVIRDSILVPVMMFSKYGDGLLKVMTSNDTPESIIKSIK